MIGIVLEFVRFHFCSFSDALKLVYFLCFAMFLIFPPYFDISFVKKGLLLSVSQILCTAEYDLFNFPTVETILRDGGVPQKPQIHVSRPKLAAKLKEAMYNLKERDGWVLLHGMAGSGKSVLASEVLEDADLLHDCFPGGVFWLSVGVVDASKLLMKMQNLSILLDTDRDYPVPRNLEEARDRIRVLFAKEYPRSLLVLDDLWTKEDARHFDVRVRTLVTSRNDFVTDNILGKYNGCLKRKLYMFEKLQGAKNN